MTTNHLTLQFADQRWLAWCQQQVAAHHYLRTPVDPRCSVLGYVVWRGLEPVGCLLFGRPESTRCYDGLLTYGSVADVASGRAQYSRWEIINLARVWLSPRLQQPEQDDYVHCAATQVISQALRRVVVEYLLAYPPCFLEQPWKLRVCLSYCDPAHHQGTIYRAANFVLARADQKETWMRPLRGLQGHERQLIERQAAQSPRSRRYRSQRAAAVQQEMLPL